LTQPRSRGNRHKAQQRSAYHEAATHKQIKMLVWFLWKDIDVGKPNSTSNAFFGLVRPNGTRKPSWSAFARLR
jgi:hypothetical protein